MGLFHQHCDSSDPPKNHTDLRLYPFLPVTHRCLEVFLCGFSQELGQEFARDGDQRDLRAPARTAWGEIGSSAWYISAGSEDTSCLLALLLFKLYIKFPSN